MEHRTSRKKGLGAFGAVVIALVCILGLLIVGGLLLLGNGRVTISASSSSVAEKPEPPVRTEQPAQSSPSISIVPAETPSPTSTPTADDRVMPELDGKAPLLTPENESRIPDIFEAVSPSVVGVINYKLQNVQGHDMMAIYGTGSGFIVSTEGYILTNAHVVEEAQKVTVLLPEGEEVEAKIIGEDKETDVAVIKISKEGLKAISLGDSDKVRVGEFVLAIGNPLDLETLSNTLTFGILSATNREITIDGHTNEYLQTDAAVNFGNSGGPLLNMNGEVIGMNSAKTMNAGTDEYGNPLDVEAIGFAIPINSVKTIMGKLITDGTIDRPAVGITVLTLTDVMAAQLGVKDGVYVQSVVKGGPADLAGMKAGDVILKVNGREIKAKEELVAVINESQIGDTIELEIDRMGETVKCNIQLGNKTTMDFNDVEEEAQVP